MLDQMAWAALRLLGEVLDSVGGLLLFGVVAGVLYARLRGRIDRLERRLEAALRARDRVAPPAGEAPPPAAARKAPDLGGPAPVAADRSGAPGPARPDSGVSDAGPAAVDAGVAADAHPAGPTAIPQTPASTAPAAAATSESGDEGAPGQPPAASTGQDSAWGDGPLPADPWSGGGAAADARAGRDRRAAGTSLNASRESSAAPRGAVAGEARGSAPAAGLLSGSVITARVAGFFAGGNWLVRGGILLLFIGVGFLLKLAVDHALLPVPLRLAGVAAGGGILVWLGLRLAPARRAYGIALQGGGVGLVYLVLYAAFRLYGLLPAGLAFGLMVVVVAAAGWLALRQDARVLAVLGAAGGFLAPLLASTGSGSHVMLFAYYAVLNAGVLGLALFRAWRVLNLVGLLATFGIGALWGARYYRPEHLATVEPFLILFFLMYLAVAVLFALHRSLRLRDPMDATVVFGNPLVAFGLQSQLVAETGHGLAASAVALAAVYGAAAWLLRARAAGGPRVLVEAFTALAVGFATVAVALHFDARWTSAAWALEGAALVWVGWRQRRALARLSGTLLQLMAGLAWLWHGLDQYGWSVEAYTGTAMLALAGLLSGAFLARHHEARAAEGAGAGDERALALVLGLWGLLWWLLGGLVHIEETVSGRHGPGAMLLFLSGSALALDVAGARVPWRLLRNAAVLLPVPLAPFAAALLVSGQSPLEHLGSLGWPVAVASTYLLLRWQERDPGRVTRAMHPLAFWVLAALLGAEGSALVSASIAGAPESWGPVGGLLLPAGLIALLAGAAARAQPWPLDAHAERYLTVVAGPVVCALGLGVLAVSVDHPGRSWPLAYLPLLNPLDLGLALVLGAVGLWFRAAGGLLTASNRTACLVAAAGLAFVWVNGALLRALHFLWQIPWRPGPMLDSTLVQASVSVLWAGTGLVAMVAASRLASRALWLTGAGLMVVVVAKLMLVDLASTGTVARVVSFISVGLLLMLVGWLAPVPPRREARAPPLPGVAAG